MNTDIGKENSINYKCKTAVLIIGFNRPDAIREAIKSVRKVALSRLYLAMDGPRKDMETDCEKCEKARMLLDEIAWCDNIYKKFRTENAGCKKNVSEAIDWAFADEERLIILEDDIVPSVSFFRFCDEMLEYYNDDDRIYQICGFNILQDYRQTEKSYYYTNFPVIWGWATWKAKWSKYDDKLSKITEKTVRRKILNRFKKNRHGLQRIINFRKAHVLAKDNQGDAWDSAWSFSIQNNDGLCIMPKRNLVKNIGFGEDALHEGRKASPFAKPYAEEIDFPLKHPKEIKADMAADAKTLEVHFKNGYPFWYAYGSMLYRLLFIREMNTGIIGWIIRSLRKIVREREKRDCVAKEN